MDHDVKMPPSKIKLAFAASLSPLEDSFNKVEVEDVVGSQTRKEVCYSAAKISSTMDDRDSSSSLLGGYESDSRENDMKRKNAANDQSRSDKDGEKSGEWWTALLESTDEHDKESPEETTKRRTPDQVVESPISNCCKNINTSRSGKNGYVKTDWPHPQQEVCEDCLKIPQQESDEEQITESSGQPIPVIQPAFASRRSHSELYTSSRAESFSTLQTNGNIPVKLQSPRDIRDSQFASGSVIQDLPQGDKYCSVPLVSTSTSSSVCSTDSLELELCTNPQAHQPVSTVHNYAFLNLINEGTYGVVYKAMHKRTGNIVAIKMLKSEKQPQGVTATGLREVNIMLKAKHINVTALLEVVYGSSVDKVYLVMEYAETDLKQLMYNMQRPFTVSETKCLLVQLLYAVQYLHENAILHRDIKTENLLVNFSGILKVTDFGLARVFSKSDKQLSPVVVTLWYRAPELLLGSETYSTPVDMWSVGCVFAELLLGHPLWEGETEIDQLHQLFRDLGTPSETIWPGYSRLPFLKSCILPEFPYNKLRAKLGWTLTELGLHLLNWFLTYCPARRVTAVQALQHWYFQEVPVPVDPQFLATQVFRTPMAYPQCFVQGSGEPQPTVVFGHPISYTHG